MATTKFSFFYIWTSDRGDFPRIIVIALYALLSFFLQNFDLFSRCPHALQVTHLVQLLLYCPRMWHLLQMLLQAGHLLSLVSLSFLVPWLYPPQTQHFPWKFFCRSIGLDLSGLFREAIPLTQSDTAVRVALPCSFCVIRLIKFPMSCLVVGPQGYLPVFLGQTYLVLGGLLSLRCCSKTHRYTLPLCI